MLIPMTANRWWMLAPQGVVGPPGPINREEPPLINHRSSSATCRREERDVWSRNCGFMP